MNRRRYRPSGLYLWLAAAHLLRGFRGHRRRRETLASRTQAVRQTLAATTPTIRTITVSAAGTTRKRFSRTITTPSRPRRPPPATIDTITGQLHAAFNRAPVSLTPAGTDWSSMTTPLTPVNGDLPGTGGTAGQDRGDRTAAVRPAAAAAERAPPGSHPRSLGRGRHRQAGRQPAGRDAPGRHDQADGGNVGPARGLRVRDPRLRASLDRHGHSGHRPGHGNRGPG